MPFNRMMISDISALLFEDEPSKKPNVYDGVEEYIEPDNLYLTKDDYCIIYTTNGKLYRSRKHQTHIEMVEDSKELSRRYGVSKQSDYVDWNTIGDEIDSRMIGLDKGDLVGRITSGFYGQKICSFWNAEKRDYDKHLSKCLQQLLSDGDLKTSDYISTPIHYTIRISETQSTKTSEIDDDMRQKLEKWRKLHLMRSQDKKNAMKDLGLSTGSRRDPMKSEMQRLGLLNPGHNWRAMHSESYDDYDTPIVEWITPDDLWGGQIENDVTGVTFIYADRLYTMPGNNTHVELIYSSKALFKRYEPYISEIQDDEQMEDVVSDMRLSAVKVDLLGRTGKSPVDGSMIISFWNDKSSKANSKLNECLRDLLDDGFISNDFIVSAPFLSDDVTVGDVLGGNSGSGGSSLSDEQLKLYQQLHLMNGNKKKIAMQKLGLGNNVVSKSKPGQKWWATTSEDFERKISSILCS